MTKLEAIRIIKKEKPDFDFKNFISLLISEAEKLENKLDKYTKYEKAIDKLYQSLA